eukprot:TRINITY_DN29996_c0_g1_i1.p1 TRINITY_DN29996_c0_g1~~TRINITY_DN29996_c0_g1_i1.p1  ORF type:complete len:274 (-),score=29.77 TRINITY_DN29996_c0_g1_i1:35-781(-)
MPSTQYGSSSSSYDRRSSSVSVKDAATEIRVAFIRKVYSILVIQLIVTVAIAAPLALQTKKQAMENSWMLMVSMVGMLVTMVIMWCCQEVLRKFPLNYLFLVVLTVCEGVMVGFVSRRYTWQSVLLSAGITAGIFICMTVYAWTASTDFTGMGPYIFAAMITLFIFGLVLSIMSAFGIQILWLKMVYNALGVLLFTFFIVYDTQLIIGEHGGHQEQFSIDDYAFAALALYLDIINLFMHLLSLLGERR